MIISDATSSDLLANDSLVMPISPPRSFARNGMALGSRAQPLIPNYRAKGWGKWQVENGMDKGQQSQRDAGLPPAQKEGPGNRANPPFLAVSPLQSSFKLPRLPVLPLQKDLAEARASNSC